MANIIKIKRGLKTNLPTLQEGELGYCTDTNELFVGTASGNNLVNEETDLSNYYTETEVDTLLNNKADLASPTLTGTPIAPTATAGTNTTQIATTAFVQTAVSELVASAPETLDTLNELAAALGNDPDFATTVATDIGTKANKTITITGANGLTGGGDLTANRTISHADTSTQASVNNSNATVIQDVTLDTYGHVTALGSTTLSASTVGAEPAFTKNTAFNKNFGTTAGTVTQGNDARLSDARTPLSHTHSAADITSGTLGVARGGTGATTFTSGNVLIGAGTGAVTTLSRSGIDSRTAFPTTYANITGTVPTWNQSTTGNAATATTLQTARTINGVSFNGSGNITITAAPNAHTHSAADITSGELNTARMGSGTATSGYVLSSDGDGTASWQEASGGSSSGVWELIRSHTGIGTSVGSGINISSIAMNSGVTLNKDDILMIELSDWVDENSTDAMLTIVLGDGSTLPNANFRFDSATEFIYKIITNSYAPFQSGGTFQIRTIAIKHFQNALYFGRKFEVLTTQFPSIDFYATSARVGKIWRLVQ